MSTRPKTVNIQWYICGYLKQIRGTFMGWLGHQAFTGVRLPGALRQLSLGFWHRSCARCRRYFFFLVSPYRRWLSTRFLYMSLRGTDYTKVRKPTTSQAVPRLPLLSSLGAEANTFLHCWRHTYPQSEQFFLLLGQRRMTFFFPGLAHQSYYSFLFLFFVLPSLIVTML